MPAVRIYAPSILLFLILAGASLASDGLIVRAYVHDMFFVADSIWRSYLGEIPHVDFQTPIGQAFYWPYALVSELSGASILDILRANVVVGLFLLLLALAVLPQRLSPLLLFLATATIVTTALTGRSVDAGIFTYDFLAPYNRWGWALAILAAFIVALRPEHDRESARRQIVDAACLGAILAILYYLKLSYFGGIAVLSVGAAMLRILSLKTFLLAALAAFLIVAVVEMLFGNNGLYLSELRRAAEINASEGRGLFRVVRTLVSLAVGAAFGAAALLIILASDRFTGARDWIGTWWRPLIMLALIIGAAAAIRTQNHARWELGMFGAALIVAAEYARRRRAVLERPEQGGAGGPGWRRIAASLLLAIGTVTIPLLDGASILAHTIESRIAAPCSAPVLRGTPMERLLFPREDLLQAYPRRGAAALCSPILTQPAAPGDAPYGDIADYRRMLWTVPALRREARPKDVILALEFANPYPFIFRSPPPKGALIWFDLGRSYSSQIHPDPGRLLSGTDIVVQTDYPYDEIKIGGPEWLRPFRQRLLSPADNAMGPGQDAWTVYGPSVRQRFTPIAETSDVRLWRKRPS
jgi:hypothetical protein